MYAKTQKEHVLVVDDTPQNVQILGTMLRDANYEVVVANNGEQALKALEHTPVDLILLDIMMPGLNGFDVCEHIKQNPKTNHIPIIFLTARNNVEDVVKGFDLGAADYVCKPFQWSELHARMRAHLDLKHYQDQIQLALEEQKRMRREHDAFVRHELNNMMQPILSFSESLLYIDETDEEKKESAQNIFDSTQRLHQLLQALKNIQNLETGNFVLNRKRVALTSVFAQAISDVKASFSENCPTIHVNNHLSTCQIQADERLLAGVFYNLIKNAVEHVINESDQTKRQVSVTMSQEGKNAMVTIQNGGVPIEPERLERFFEKFNTDHRYKKGGTGLGTTYAYWVTRSHGGNITVASNANEGTTVTVTLPCQTA